MLQSVPADEVFAFCRQAWFGREGDSLGIQHDLISENLLLSAAFPKGSLAKQHLVQHHSC